MTKFSAILSLEVVVDVQISTRLLLICLKNSFAEYLMFQKYIVNLEEEARFFQPPSLMLDLLAYNFFGKVNIELFIPKISPRTTTSLLKFFVSAKGYVEVSRRPM